MVRCSSQPRSAAPSLGGGKPGELLATFQRAHVIHAVGSLLFILELGQATVLSGMVGQGVLFPKDETHFRCIHTMPHFSQACLLGYIPSPQHAFQGEAAHQAQRRTWLTPNDS